MKVIVTGGSGFIGTNLIDYLDKRGFDVVSVDINPPQNKEHYKFYQRVDILDFLSLEDFISSNSPDFIVHLAARTDLDGKSIEDYKANINGVLNLLKASNQAQGLKKIIFASTKLIVPVDKGVADFTDYSPDSMYGSSKVIGEMLVETNKYTNNWVIVRPTSIWGPWSMSDHIPYGRFFKMISRGVYFHPAALTSKRYFGYVVNSCAQIHDLMIASENEVCGNKYYLADYKFYKIKEWADLISIKFRGRKNIQIPMIIVRLFAVTGDLLKIMGYKNPPFSSFRLKNMQADTTMIPLDNIKQITPVLPCDINRGIDETIKWMRSQKI
jgi:GlcNAc-P-P-Und epimerase